MAIAKSSMSSGTIEASNQPSIRTFQEALQLVAESISEFDLTSKAWMAHHESGHNAIIGRAWADFQSFAHQRVGSLRGLRILRQAVQKELTWLEKYALSVGGNVDLPCPNSNALYICTSWSRAILAAHDHAPILELDAAFPVPENTSGVAGQAKPTKVDIVCEGGRHWIRIATIKPITLLSEFRAAESEVTSESDEEIDEGEGEPRLGDAPVSSMQATVMQMKSQLANAELDIGTRQCSLVRVLHDLDQAAQLFAEMHPNPSFGRPSVELHLTRLSEHGIVSLHHKFYDAEEEDRYQARLRAIAKEAKRLRITLRWASSESDSTVTASESINARMLHLPKISTPPLQVNPLPTRSINLDLSALVAFVSYISHMQFPARAEDAALCFPAATEGIELLSKNGNVDGRGIVENEESEHDEADTDDRDDAGFRRESTLHARALSKQLRREMVHGSFFDIVLRHVDDGQKLHLICTREAKEKLLEITTIVGGVIEAKRARLLFQADGREDFWRGSRWQHNARIREAIALPIKVVDDPPGGLDLSSSFEPFEKAFARLAQESLQLGIDVFDHDIRSSHGNSNVTRQSRHTLASMLAGINNHQTTLTTNVNSVKWVVRDVNRLQIHKGKAPGYAIEAAEEQDCKALVWVMYPRSLAERMAIKSADSDYFDPANNAATGLSYDGSASPSDEAWLKRGAKSRGNSTPAIATLLHHEGQSGDTGYDMTENSPSSTHKSLSILIHWLRGPRPRAHLTIKHFKWWPMQPIENAWMKVTNRVAWKDPHANGDITLLNQRVDIESASDEQNRSWSRHIPSDDPWWNGVRMDARKNSLHWFLLAFTFVGWAIGFAFLVKSLWYEGSVIDADGQRSNTAFYGCTTTFWTANSGCGINGESCAPFSVDSPYDFRCPANCQTTHLGGKRAVGDQLPAYVALVVGGSNVSSSTGGEEGSDIPFVYRGDSFICSAAIHAGIMSASKGGCGRVWLNGAYSGYEGVQRNGLTSTPFNSTFPLSFYFDEDVGESGCQDRRSRGYVLNVVLMAWVGFVLRPKHIVLFYTLVCVGYWHINFLSEPRKYPMSIGEPMGDFLPTLFVSYALWRLNFRFMLPAFAKVPVEATVYVQALYWIGVMLDVVFVNVPLQRLVWSDIAEEPGALTSLIVIIVIVVVLAINQIRVIRKTGLLPKYLTLAIIGGILIALLAAVPTTGLRLHHYIIALVLLPFCAFETRLSLLYSAFLLGMFLNGVGRWGYDGIIQDESTIIGSGVSGSALPSFLAASHWSGVSPFNDSSTAVTFSDALAQNMTGYVSWNAITDNLTSTWDSFQLLVDDILRLQGNTTKYNLGSLASNYISFGNNQTEQGLSSLYMNYTLFPGGASSQNILSTIVNQPHYLRLAYYNSVTGALGDFTNAATVWFNGTFVSPLPGAT